MDVMKDFVLEHGLIEEEIFIKEFLELRDLNEDTKKKRQF